MFYNVAWHRNNFAPSPSINSQTFYTLVNDTNLKSFFSSSFNQYMCHYFPRTGWNREDVAVVYQNQWINLFQSLIFELLCVRFEALSCISLNVSWWKYCLPSDIEFNRGRKLNGRVQSWWMIECDVKWFHLVVTIRIMITCFASLSLCDMR